MRHSQIRILAVLVLAFAMFPPGLSAERRRCKAAETSQAAVDLATAIVGAGVEHVQTQCPTLEAKLREDWEIVRKPLDRAVGKIIDRIPRDSPLLASATHHGFLGVPDDERVPPGLNDRAVVLAVDGMDPISMLAAEPRHESELAKLLQELPAFQRCAIRGFIWSGKLKEAGPATAQLVREIEDAAVTASRAGLPFCIVSHSFGCAMVYRGLHESHVLIGDDVDVWISLAAPLCAQGEARLARTRAALGSAPYPIVRPAAVSRWLNYFTAQDRISGSIPAATNRLLPDAPGFDHFAPQYTRRLGDLSDLGW